MAGMNAVPGAMEPAARRHAVRPGQLDLHSPGPLASVQNRRAWPCRTVPPCHWGWGGLSRCHWVPLCTGGAMRGMSKSRREECRTRLSRCSVLGAAWFLAPPRRCAMSGPQGPQARLVASPPPPHPPGAGRSVAGYHFHRRVKKAGAGHRAGQGHLMNSTAIPMFVEAGYGGARRADDLGGPRPGLAALAALPK